MFGFSYFRNRNLKAYRWNFVFEILDVRFKLQDDKLQSKTHEVPGEHACVLC